MRKTCNSHSNVAQITFYHLNLASIKVETYNGEKKEKTIIFSTKYSICTLYPPNPAMT